MKCPKCDSEKVRSYDNQPLHHPEKSEMKSIEDYNQMGVDYEIYISMVCDDCDHTFEDSFKIVKETKTYCGWTTEDVELTLKAAHKEGLYTDIKYTEELGTKVMSLVEETWDANYGVNWESIINALETIIKK